MSCARFAWLCGRFVDVVLRLDMSVCVPLIEHLIWFTLHSRAEDWKHWAARQRQKSSEAAGVDPCSDEIEQRKRKYWKFRIDLIPPAFITLCHACVDACRPSVHFMTCWIAPTGLEFWPRMPLRDSSHGPINHYARQRGCRILASKVAMIPKSNVLFFSSPKSMNTTTKPLTFALPNATFPPPLPKKIHRQCSLVP